MAVVEPKYIGIKINQNGLPQTQFILFLVLYFKIYEGYPENNLRFGVAWRWAGLAPLFWCQSVPSLSTHPAVVARGLCCFCFVNSEFLKCVLQ